MPKTIIIQEADTLISLDMAQTIAEAWPDASVVVCRDPAQVHKLLSQGCTPDAIILSQSLRHTRQDGLAQLASKTGAMVLLTQADDDEDVTITAARWHRLDMPFSSAQLRDVLLDGCPSLYAATENNCKALGLG